MKVLYMGTPEFSKTVLDGLLENNYNVIGVVTQPDKTVGRSHKIIFSPVKELALKNNILVLQPSKIKVEYEEILNLQPDIIITCAYGQIIPKAILDYPKYGCINVHASLLPKLRGGAPIHHAIIDGYKKTGITIMKMGLGMDDGDIISSISTTITDEDTVGTLHDRLMSLGKELLIKTLPNILRGNYTLTSQNPAEVTYGFNIKREEEKINFNKGAREVFNHIRGLNPWPGSYTSLNGKVYKIYNVKEVMKNTSKEPGTIVEITKDSILVQTKENLIEILELKPEGKNLMPVRSFLNGVDKENLLGKKFE